MFNSYFLSYVFIAFLWGNVVFVRVQCRSTTSIPEESKSSGQMERCLMKCGISVGTDVRGISTEEMPIHHSCYDKCLGMEGKRNSLVTKRKPFVNPQITSSLKRIKRDASNSEQNKTSPTIQINTTRVPNGEQNPISSTMTEYASKCLINDPGANPFFPDVIKMTFEEIKNTGRYLGKVSWTPFDNQKVKNWTGYIIMYSLQDEKIGDTQCQELDKNVTNYTITNFSYGLTRDSEVHLIVTSLPNAVPKDDLFFVFDCEVPLDCSSVPFKGVPPTQSTGVPPTQSTGVPSTQSTGVPPTQSTGGNNKGTSNVIIIVVIALVCGIVLTGLLVVWYCRRSKSSPFINTSLPSSDLEFEYDAFIIFSSEDSDFVVKTLIPTLEEKHRLKCCVHYRDFALGVPIRKNMVDSVYKCRKTVAVVSNHFFNSNYCGSELDYALHRLMEKKDDSLVVIKLDNVDRGKLPKELQKRSYIDYPKSVEKESWEKKLVSCLKVPNYSPKRKNCN